MKVVVFGGSGFLGSFVGNILAEQGHSVIIYDKIPSPYLLHNERMVVADIFDQQCVDKTVRGSDIVYNFAGIADIEEASRMPLETVKTNILGTAIILEACKKAKVKRFIFASSIYVYSRTGGFYRSSKQACELLIENYQEVYKIPYTILRYGSLYGPRANDKNPIYRMLTQAITKKKIQREGDGEELREYIHVWDAARMSTEILSDEFKNQSVIIAGNQQMKVKDFFVMIKEILDNKITIDYVPQKSKLHYEITPYTFAPKVAQRYVSKTYLDLGQGILHCIQDIYAQLHRNQKEHGQSHAKTKKRTR